MSDQEKPEHWSVRLRRNARDLFENHYTGLEGFTAEIVERAYAAGKCMGLDVENNQIFFAHYNATADRYDDVEVYKIKPSTAPQRFPIILDRNVEPVQLSAEAWKEYTEAVLSAFGTDEGGADE